MTVPNEVRHHSVQSLLLSPDHMYTKNIVHCWLLHSQSAGCHNASDPVAISFKPHESRCCQRSHIISWSVMHKGKCCSRTHIADQGLFTYMSLRSHSTQSVVSSTLSSASNVFMSVMEIDYKRQRLPTTLDATATEASACKQLFTCRLCLLQQACLWSLDRTILDSYFRLSTRAVCSSHHF